MYVYLGTAARSITDVLNQSSKRMSGTRTTIYTICGVITVLLVILISVISAREIKKQIRKAKIEKQRKEKESGLNDDKDIELKALLEDSIIEMGDVDMDAVEEHCLVLGDVG